MPASLPASNLFTRFGEVSQTAATAPGTTASHGESHARRSRSADAEVEEQRADRDGGCEHRVLERAEAKHATQRTPLAHPRLAERDVVHREPARRRSPRTAAPKPMLTTASAAGKEKPDAVARLCRRPQPRSCSRGTRSVGRPRRARTTRRCRRRAHGACDPTRPSRRGLRAPAPRRRGRPRA